MKVIKIGGTALSNSKSINKFCSSFKNLTTPSIVVVSALGKLSAELKNHFYSPTFNDNYSPFISIFTEFRHLLCQNYLNQFDEYTLQCQKKLTDIMAGCEITEEYLEESLDKILVLGELVSSFFIHCVLKSNNIESQFLDIRGTIITDSNFGKAKPNVSKSIENLSSLSYSNLTITQGFIASDKYNNDTTMGFESSNLSALLIAKALECDSIDIYTKVNQIHILDPELYDTHPVNYIPYRSAKRLALSGNKLFFPGMIELAESREIVIKYKGLESTKETIISEKDAFDYPVIYKRDNEYIITPIKSDNAISIIQKHSSKIGDFSYTIQDFTLALIRCELKEIEIQESVISLLKKY